MHLDVRALQRVAERFDCRIWAVARPGSRAVRGEILAWVDHPDEEMTVAVQHAFVVQQHREFAHDPRLGLTTLSEISSRALSQRINDPGTAIEVFAALQAVVSDAMDATVREPRFDRVHRCEISPADIVEDAFAASARDGADTIEVAMRLQGELGRLIARADARWAEALRAMARTAFARCQQALTFLEDLERLARRHEDALRRGGSRWAEGRQECRRGSVLRGRRGLIAGWSESTRNGPLRPGHLGKWFPVMTESGTPALTVRELVAIAYGNLAMAHYAVARGDATYSRTAYMVRARLTRGLRTGGMAVGSLFDDERVKVLQGARCSYCGSGENLALDHLIPRRSGGPESGDNLVVACRGCNSSKGSKDVLVWCRDRGEFPPLMVLRRYLKLVLIVCEDAGVMDESVGSADLAALPFAFEAIPTGRFPNPCLLRL